MQTRSLLYAAFHVNFWRSLQLCQGKSYAEPCIPIYAQDEYSSNTYRSSVSGELLLLWMQAVWRGSQIAECGIGLKTISTKQCRHSLRPRNFRVGSNRNTCRCGAFFVDVLRLSSSLQGSTYEWSFQNVVLVLLTISSHHLNQHTPGARKQKWTPLWTHLLPLQTHLPLIWSLRMRLW